MVTVADTAFSIAVVRAEEREKAPHERLFEDPYASLFQAGSADAEEATQRYLDLPFFREGVRLRTRYIDDAVRAGLEAGLGQLVLLGAGFDMRGLRMREVAERGVKVFEVDTPAQLERKRAMMRAGGVDLPAHVIHAPIEFETGFEEALPGLLEEQGYRRGGGAMFVWEGVIGYIDRPAIDRSLRLMSGAGGPRTRVAFTFVPSVFEPDTVLAGVGKAGFDRLDGFTMADLWRQHLQGEPAEVASMSWVGTAFV